MLSRLRSKSESIQHNQADFLNQQGFDKTVTYDLHELRVTYDLHELRDQTVTYDLRITRNKMRCVVAPNVLLNSE